MHICLLQIVIRENQINNTTDNIDPLVRMEFSIYILHDIYKLFKYFLDLATKKGRARETREYEEIYRNISIADQFSRGILCFKIY